MKSYVERRPEGFYLTGSRVPLDMIVLEYWNGEAAESIQRHYPTLTVEQVYGAIAFYLGNRAAVDTVIEEREREADAFRVAHPIPEALLSRLLRAREVSASRKSSE